MLKSNGLHMHLSRKIVMMAVLLLLAISTLAIGLFLPVQAAAPAQGQDAMPTPGSMMHGGTMGSGMMGEGMSMADMGAMMDQMMGYMQSMMGMAPMSATMPMLGTTPMPGTMPMSGIMNSGMMQMCAMMHMGISMPMTGTMPMTGMMFMTGTMPMSGTMPMMPMSDMMSIEHMGMMMQMMGMMQMHMGCMQMMMGAMMSGSMMDSGMMGSGMMGEGMMGEGMGDAAPEAAETAPDATATVEPTATAVVTESTESSEPETATSDEGHPIVALAATPQSATAGAITVEATPLTTDELLDVAFAVTLETHSVELDFDLAERATLTIGEFNVPAISWSPNAPSGHHVEGTLHFTIDHPAHAALAEADAVTLELQDIDGQSVTLSFAVE